MPRLGVLTTLGEPSTATWFLATTTDVVLFYVFDPHQPARFSLLDQLDRSRVPGFGNKKTAAAFAKRLGLKSWTYVRI